jgi:hypothetical protein
MSYKRTIHCRQCGQPGHNRSSCPQQKAYIARRRELYGDGDHVVRQHDAKKARRAAAAKNRSCSYCGSTDHNRRGCQALKDNMAAYEAKNATFRRSFLQAMIQTGFGPGAMVQQRSWRGSTMIIRVITSLDWANITFWGYSNHYFEARKPSLVGQSVRAWQVDDLRFPRLQDGVIKKSEYTPDIVVRASEEAIRRAMPAGWLDGAGDTKAVFSNKRGLFHSIKHSQLDLSQWEDKVPGL